MLDFFFESECAAWGAAVVLITVGEKCNNFAQQTKVQKHNTKAVHFHHNRLRRVTAPVFEFVTFSQHRNARCAMIQSLGAEVAAAAAARSLPATAHLATQHQNG